MNKKATQEEKAYNNGSLEGYFGARDLILVGRIMKICDCIADKSKNSERRDSIGGKQGGLIHTLSPATVHARRRPSNHLFCTLISSARTRGCCL
jgi:hypothetical protein